MGLGQGQALFFIILFSLLNPNHVFASPSFLWGAAWSAHQTEGWDGGGEGSDWTAFEEAHGIESSRRSIDHWNRYSEDLELARDIGLNTVRLSVSWAKLEPSPGVFSRDAFRHYRDELTVMRAKGLTPMIALHHFVNPAWFHAQGSWLSPDAPRYFLRFATEVVLQLGDLCDTWITFNEPMVYVIMGFLKGEIPPEQTGVDSAFLAAFQIARAHRMVTAMIHGQQGFSPNARGTDQILRGVGFSNSFHLYTPFDREDSRDQEAARVLADLNNWSFLHGIQSDRLRFEIPSQVPGGRVYEREFPVDDIPEWHRGLSFMDWMGVNYYTRYLIKYQPYSDLRAEWRIPETDMGVNDLGWAIDPEGLEEILRETGAQFPALPLVVTESGLPDATDAKRPEFLRRSLAALDRARTGAGALDIRGYYHWSLFDNFEWLSGYGPRFGLFEILYNENLRRRARPSAAVYREEIIRRMPER